MTGDLQIGFASIMLHPFLDATDGERLPGERPLLHQKDPLHFVCRSDPEILQKSLKGIVADVDDPILCALAILDVQRSAFEIHVAE